MPAALLQEPFHTPCDVWGLGMVLLWSLLLKDPMGERSIPEWEVSA